MLTEEVTTVLSCSLWSTVTTYSGILSLDGQEVFMTLASCRILASMTKGTTKHNCSQIIIKERIGDQDVPIVILGDPAYPLLPWLLRAYPENTNTPPKGV